MGDYATKEEHQALESRVNEGFEKVNSNINKLADSLQLFVQKSITSDQSLKDGFLKELEHREEVKRTFNTKMYGLIFSLAMAIWSAVWWGINEHDDKKRYVDKLEQCNRMHDLDKRLLILEIGHNETN